MEFEVGDTVIISENLKMEAPNSRSPGINTRMLDFRGRKATIMEIRHAFTGHFDYYKLDIDHQHHNWTDEMLERKSRITLK